MEMEMEMEVGWAGHLGFYACSLWFGRADPLSMFDYFILCVYLYLFDESLYTSLGGLVGIRD